MSVVPVDGFSVAVRLLVGCGGDGAVVVVDSWSGSNEVAAVVRTVLVCLGEVTPVGVFVWWAVLAA